MEALHKLDIYSLEDLIAFLPVKYRDLTAVAKLNAVSTDTPALFKVRCMQKPTVRYPRKNFPVTSWIFPAEHRLFGLTSRIWRRILRMEQKFIFMVALRSSREDED